MSELKIVARSYRSVLPYSLVIVYQRKGQFRNMVEQAISTYPELVYILGEECNDAQAFVYHVNGSNIFMFITDDITMDIIVHECTHVVFAIYDIIGQTVSTENDEFFAYLTEHVFREVMSAIKTEFKLNPKIASV